MELGVRRRMAARRGGHNKADCRGGGGSPEDNRGP